MKIWRSLNQKKTSRTTPLHKLLDVVVEMGLKPRRFYWRSHHHTI
jgi:hypothetical protein